MEPASSTATATTSSSSPSSSQQRVGARELRGPRPAPLRVRRDSHRIRKPPVQVRQPVIIYTVSPRVVHAEPSEFMSVVQRLTGLPAPPPPAETYPFFGGHHVPSSIPQLQFPFQLLQQPAAGPHELTQLSPAAHLADIQQAAARSAGPPLPSILSPVPGSLPAVQPSFFSPPAGARDAGGGINLFGDLISPAFLGATTTGASQIVYPTLPSPSGAYYWDLFNNRQNL